MNKKTSAIIIALLIVISAIPLTTAFNPHSGDTFSYYQVTNLGSGTGDYTGYTEHATYQGTESITGVSADTVSAHYSYSYSWSNSSGSTETGNPSGDFTFSANNFLYISGTDDQTGYTNPTVWFAMDNSIPTGGTFTLLDTQMTIISKNYTYYIPSQNKYVNTIFTQGNSGYQRNDVYGQFSVSYTWKVYFDPASGYIVGYTYEEQNTNPSAEFTYTENLYVTSTSYPLTTSAANPTQTTPPNFFTIPPTTRTNQSPIPSIFVLATLLIIIITVVIAALYAISNSSKKTLPRHAYEQPYQPPPPPPGPTPENINLTPKQPPIQQIVIKEVVKVNCRYCGALIDSTAQSCPFCGAPRT
jgi:hypothetical protein